MVRPNRMFCCIVMATDFETSSMMEPVADQVRSMGVTPALPARATPLHRTENGRLAGITDPNIERAGAVELAPRSDLAVHGDREGRFDGMQVSIVLTNVATAVSSP